MLGAWDVASFLPAGPNKRDLDVIWPTTTVMLFDNSGHSVWFNRAGLKAVGIDAHTRDRSAGISVFVRDKAGEPTGWGSRSSLRCMRWDRAGKLPIRVFGSYHIWDPVQIDDAVAQLRPREIAPLHKALGMTHL